jgi:DNA-directed RNA polymerase subunit RPC12/RpoP
MYSSSEEEEEYDCPLCMEELDIADRNFKPCPCGYKVPIIKTSERPWV